MIEYNRAVNLKSYNVRKLSQDYREPYEELTIDSSIGEPRDKNYTTRRRNSVIKSSETDMIIGDDFQLRMTPSNKTRQINSLFLTSRTRKDSIKSETNDSQTSRIPK